MKPTQHRTGRHPQHTAHAGGRRRRGEGAHGGDADDACARAGIMAIADKIDF
jgi:hypothetical protein